MTGIRTINSLIESFERNDGTAVIHNGDQISYQEFYDDISSLSHVLSEKYELEGSRVAVLCDDKYKQILGIYSTIYAGGVAVPLDTSLSDSTIKRLVEVTDSIILLTDGTDIQQRLQVDKIRIQREISEQRLYPSHSVNERETALILFTSGTTGQKKAVQLSHKNLIETSKYINGFMGVDESITEHILVPIYHSFGFARTRCVFLKGGSIVIDDGQLNPLLAFKRISRFNCDAFSGVPSIMAMLIKAGDKRFSQIADQIRYVEIGSAPMSRDHKEYLTSRLENANICMHYGLTEASRTCFIDFRKESDKLDSVGQSSPGVDVKIIDGNGNEQPANEVGEIAVNGPNVAKGYVKKSVTDEDAEIGDWFRTGDLGFKDEDGYVYFQGRKDNIINVGGEKISPVEIERLISESGLAPQEFCVVGGADKDGIYDTVPVMCTSDTDFGINELQDLNQKLDTMGLKESFQPDRIHHLDQIPKTDNGKIIRHEIEPSESVL